MLIAANDMHTGFCKALLFINSMCKCNVNNLAMIK